MTREQLVMIRTLVLAVGLLGLGIEDLWKKQISSLPLLLLAVAGGGISLALGDWGDGTALWRLLPGCVMLLLAWLTRESIGYGDGFVVLCLGCFLDVWEILNICMAALTLSGLAALFLLLVKKKNRKTQMPFVPFLLVGYGMQLLLSR